MGYAPGLNTSVWIKLIVVCACWGSIAGCTSKSRESLGKNSTGILDVGFVRQGSTVGHEFEYTNTQSSPVTVTGVSSSCQCTVTQLRIGTEIGPGESVSIPVTVDLTGKTGPFSQEVAIDFGSDVKPVLFSVRGTVFQEHPVEIDFGRVLRDADVSQSFTLRPFPGMPAMQVEALHYSSTLFEVAMVRDPTEESAMRLQIVIKDGVPPGSFLETLAIVTNDLEVPTKKVALRGYVEHELEVSEPEVFLGSLTPGVTRAARIRLHSPYGSQFTLSRIENSAPEVLSVDVSSHGPSDIIDVALSAGVSLGTAGKNTVFKAEVYFVCQLDDVELRRRVEVYAAH